MSIFFRLNFSGSLIDANHVYDVRGKWPNAKWPNLHDESRCWLKQRRWQGVRVFHTQPAANDVEKRLLLQQASPDIACRG